MDTPCASPHRGDRIEASPTFPLWRGFLYLPEPWFDVRVESSEGEYLEEAMSGTVSYTRRAEKLRDLADQLDAELTVGALLREANRLDALAAREANRRDKAASAAALDLHFRARLMRAERP